MNTTPAPLNLIDFDYVLPTELIAQFPQSTRSASRLLHVDQNGQHVDRSFVDLIELLKPNDLLVFNNTRVIKARIYGHKTTGGAIEVLIERVTGVKTALAHIKASKSPPVGTELVLAHAVTVRVMGRLAGLYDLSFDQPVLDVLDQYGEVPLPPYIQHCADDTDAQRYQTVYAKIPGAVAAPTAGLHFTPEILSQIRHTFLTLHVGAGTFLPVKTEKIADHEMHEESYSISAHSAASMNTAKRIVAVGTTATRVLESQPPGPLRPCEGRTGIFIYPPYEFQRVGALLTNFHLPESTLLMLVSAFAGREAVFKAYQEAINEGYRFYSYGDCMLIVD